MKLLRTHLPCPSCSSSDAYSEYEDGHGYCFSCKKLFKDDILDTNQECTYEFLPWRGVTRETMSRYSVYSKVDSSGRPLSLGYQYPNDAVKVRSLNDKKFYSTGDMSSATLFGMDKFSAGSAKAVTITEGELDALSVFQMLGSKYPVVSVRSSSSAKKDCGSALDYLNSFEKIYLCFDNDEPGQSALREVAALFDFNRVYHVQLTKHKDANDYLSSGDEAEFSRVWWNSKRFLPEGIVSSFSEVDSIIDADGAKDGVAYPFPKLQSMTYGMREGECILFTALEGIGKTEIVRAIEYHVLKETDLNVGIIHLEEDKARQIKGLAGYELQAPAHLPDSTVSNDEIKQAFRRLVSRDERLHLYSHFGSTDPDVILDTIRFLVSACGCKLIVLDHISMVVSGLLLEDERKQLDYLSTKLAMMAKDLSFTLIYVSHVNDDGLTRGSRNISKVAHTWVHLLRDLISEDPVERNTTVLLVNKNRFGSKTGPADKLFFDEQTFMVRPLQEKDRGMPVVLPTE